jgi:ABC-2 type transport system permease protein
MMNGTMIQASNDFSPDLVTPGITATAAAFTKPLARQAANGMKVSMPGVAGLSYLPGSPFQMQPLLITDSATTWNRVKKLDLDLMTTATATTTTASAAMDGAERPAAGKPVAVTAPKVINIKNAATGEIKSITVSLPGAKRSGSADTAAAASPRVFKMTTIGDAPRAMGSGHTDSGAAHSSIIQMQTVHMPVAANHRRPDTTAAGKRMRLSSEEATTVLQERPVRHTGTPVVLTPDGEPSGGRHSRAQLGTIAFSPADGDTRGAIPTAVSLTRQLNGKEQRIIVTGDADFMCNAELQRMNMRTANFNFNTALFSWLAYNAFPIDTSRPESEDNRLKLNGKNVSVLRIMYIWVLPALLLLSGTVLLIRRKRK